MIETRYRVRPDVYLADSDGGWTLVLTGRRAERLGPLTADELDLLRALAAGPLARPEAHGALVDRLRDGGWLTQHVWSAGRPLVTVEPLGPNRSPETAPPAAPRLTRFAVLRRDGDGLVLEAPHRPARFSVHDDAVLALLHRLADGRSPEVDLQDDAVAAVVALLAHHGFLDGGDDADSAQWSPHELWFHHRSRAGNHDLPHGATGWALGKHPALPARREPWPGPAVPLPVPATPLAAPFGDTLAARRSLRRGDDANPLTAADLGAFLHHAARVAGSRGDGLTLRPTPSGGALHSLEIYPLVVNAADLGPGLYHYDPFGHLLEPVPAPDAALRQLVGAAVAASEHATAPQVLLVLTARFGRVLRKYQSMGYTLVLKEVGALTQTMYLVATAMGLAPCALGAGDADLFAAATGLDPLAEASVGEFILSTSDRSR